MNGIIDFHSHILPGIDDGSSSVEESIAMLKREAEQGITHVVATPHFYARHDNPEHFFRRRAEAEQLLREEMEKHTGLPQLSVGAEVQFFAGMSHSDVLPALTMGQTKCVLVEMLGVPWTEKMYHELEHLRYQCGLIPVIAHVDRYITPFRTYRIPERLEELPVLVQANAGFFLSPRTRKMAMKMLQKDQIQLLGSDCHNLTSRVPNLGQAVELIRQRCGDAVVKRIQTYQDTAFMNE